MAARIGARAVIGQGEEFQNAPLRRPGEVGHGLAQFAFLVGMFHEVGLVDDVDEVLRFRDAPEHAVHAQPQLPFPVAGFTEHQKVGFAQVGVGAA